MLSELVAPTHPYETTHNRKELLGAPLRPTRKRTRTPLVPTAEINADA